MNTAQIFASLYLDKEVAEGTLKEYQPISIFGEVNTDQLSAYRPTHFGSFLSHGLENFRSPGAY